MLAGDRGRKTMPCSGRVCEYVSMRKMETNNYKGFSVNTSNYTFLLTSMINLNYGVKQSKQTVNS